MKKLLAAALVLFSVSAQALAQKAPVVRADIYYAYFVRTYVLRDASSAVDPENALARIVITEGPMSFAEGLQRSREIRLEGVCRIIWPSPTDPGKATCYPARRISMVEVVSP